MPDEERVKKGLLLPIIDIHWSDLSLVIGIYIIGPKKSIVFGLSHAGEAGVGGALGKTLIRIVLLDSDIGCPVAMFSLVSNTQETCQRTTRAGNGNCSLAFLGRLHGRKGRQRCFHRGQCRQWLMVLGEGMRLPHIQRLTASL